MARFGPKRKSLMTMTDEQIAEFQSWLKNKRLTVRQISAMIEQQYKIKLSYSAVHNERVEVLEEARQAAEAIRMNSETTAEIARLLKSENPGDAISNTINTATQLIGVAIHRTALSMARGEEVKPAALEQMARVLFNMNQSVSRGLSNEEKIEERNKAKQELLAKQARAIEGAREDGTLTPAQEIQFKKLVGIL